MRYLPINLAVEGKNVVIVGGGEVALRKCRSLLAAGAAVSVIAPLLAEGLALLRADGSIRHVRRDFAPGDLAGAFLVLAATDDPAVNREVAREAETRGIPVDVADAPDLCSFTLPAVMRRGDLQIAVSTGGCSPALARRVRDELEERYGPEYEVALLLLGRLREKLLTEKGNSAYNKKIFNELVGHDLPALIRNRSFEELDGLLTGLFGPGFTLSGLGVGEKDNP